MVMTSISWDMGSYNYGSVWNGDSHGDSPPNDHPQSEENHELVISCNFM